MRHSTYLQCLKQTEEVTTNEELRQRIWDALDHLQDADFEGIGKIILEASESGRILCGTTEETRLLAVKLIPFGLASEDDHVVGMMIKYATGNLDLAGNVVFLAVWLARWAQDGMPTLRLNENQASSFALSDLSDDQLNRWKPPWRSFMISIPQIIPNTFIRRIGVQKIDVKPVGLEEHDRIHDSIFVRVEKTNPKELIFNAEGSAKDLHDVVKSNLVSPDAYGNTLKNKKIIELCTRITLNAVVAMSCKDQLRRINTGIVKKNAGRKRSKKTKKYRKIKKYGLTEFILGTPVVVNHTRYIQEYCNSKTARFHKARWLVRGHWRNQAYGPGRSLRKEIFIEPFWKGDERSSVILREHQIKEKLNV